MYIPRLPSQGTDIFLNAQKFLAGADQDSKAFHHQYGRVVVQESSPQNNFRRVIAAILPANEFCNHTINYVPAHLAQLPLGFITGLLNSDLIDWYFRLGSTNAHVSHYQLYNLPCPHFASTSGQASNQTVAQAEALIEEGDFESAETFIRNLIIQPPFDRTIASIIATIVGQIIQAERQRGPVSRAARSELAPISQSWQDVIDRSLAMMAGINREEHGALRNRLAAML